MVETGWFYGGFIDPILIPIRKRINNEVTYGDSMIDIACGTGAQIFKSASKISKAVGVDLSQSMINKAVRTKKRKNIEHVEFLKNDATNLSLFPEHQFEIATMSLALHQFDSTLYAPILNEMRRVAKKIIIVDYAVPLPQNYLGMGSRVAEFMAGTEHHRNFRKFCSLGGLNEILPGNQLEITKSVLFGEGAFQLVVCISSDGTHLK